MVLRQCESTCLIKSPEIEVPIKAISQIHCRECGFEYDFSEAEQRIWFVNLEKRSEYICLKCMKNTNGTRRYSPYVCVKLELDGSDVESSKTIKIPGIIIRHYGELPESVYGLGCDCKLGCDFSRFTCIDCANMRKVCWSRYLNDENGCVENNHRIVLEHELLTFWSERMSQEEKAHFDHQKEQIEK